MSKNKHILKNIKDVCCIGLIPISVFIGMTVAIPNASESYDYEAEAKEIKERVYQEYILTDEFVEKQLNFSNSLNDNYQNGSIDNQEYQKQISYMTSKQFAFDLIETTEYNFLKNENARAENLETQAESAHKKAKTALIVAGSAIGASIITTIGCHVALKKQEKKEDAQQKSHELCQKV